MTAPRDDGSPWPPPSGGEQDPDATWLAPTSQPPPPPSYQSGPTPYPPNPPGAGYPPPQSPPQPSYGQFGQQPYGAPTPDYPAAPYPAAPYPAAPPPPPLYPGAGYPQYPGGPAGNPYYSGPSSGNNGMAIASLVTAIAGVVIGIPFSVFCYIGFLIPVVALVLGIVALNQIKQSQQPGRGLALAGIWTSAVTLGLLVLLFIIGVAAIAANSR